MQLESHNQPRFFSRPRVRLVHDVSYAPLVENGLFALVAKSARSGEQLKLFRLSPQRGHFLTHVGLCSEEVSRSYNLSSQESPV